MLFLARVLYECSSPLCCLPTSAQFGSLPIGDPIPKRLSLRHDGAKTGATNSLTSYRCAFGQKYALRITFSPLPIFFSPPSDCRDNSPPPLINFYHLNFQLNLYQKDSVEQCARIPETSPEFDSCDFVTPRSVGTRVFFNRKRIDGSLANYF